MRNVIVNEWMSLDGVVQGPSSPDEVLRPLRLVDHRLASTGAILATYARAAA